MCINDMRPCALGNWLNMSDPQSLHAWIQNPTGSEPLLSHCWAIAAMRTPTTPTTCDSGAPAPARSSCGISCGSVDFVYWFLGRWKKVLKMWNLVRSKPKYQTTRFKSGWKPFFSIFFLTFPLFFLLSYTFFSPFFQLLPAPGVWPGRLQLGAVPGRHHPAAQGRGPLGGAVPQRALATP